MIKCIQLIELFLRHNEIVETQVVGSNLFMKLNDLIKIDNIINKIGGN